MKNELPTDKIPSLKLVKKQLREISLQLHPDKNVDDSEEVKNAKSEKVKHFLDANKKLREILVEKELINGEEENVEFDEEDDLTDEEIEKIKKKGWKVRDHDHWTGQYRGAAHSGCNLAMRKVKKIPVVFHNLAGNILCFYYYEFLFFFHTGYDSHIIMQALNKVKCKSDC